MTIEVLFPEICNLYGDLANVRYIAESINGDSENADSKKEELSIIETHLTDEPVFVHGDPDLIYIGTMTENSQKLVINKLSGYRDRIAALIENGKTFLVTGNAIEIFGGSIIEDGKEVAQGLGIFDFVSERSSIKRSNCIYVGDFHDGDDIIKVVGFKSVFGFAYGPALDNQLFDSIVGYGSNKETVKEGIRYNNFIGTYTIGPLLVLNPLFTKWFLSNRLHSDASPAFYDAAMDAYQTRLDEYLTPGKGWEY